jgi:predicted aldo/keto reductase-like oxidoreductase
MMHRYAQVMYDRYCRFCGTCEARCPHSVAVAEVMRYAMYFNGYGREKEAMSLYAELPESATARACEVCDGVCESACPFGRPVREELVSADRLLRLEKV